jgi:tetratricopeptide (TPR) repeat protein/ferredoxin
MLVNPGCMKCLDCVSVCPKDALYWGFGKPATSKGAPRTGRIDRRFDLDVAGEVGVAVTFLLAFLAWRSAYGLVPLLMAVGIALCVTYLAWTVMRLLRREDVVVQNLALASGGRRRSAGVAALGLGLLVFALTTQSGVVALAHAAARRYDAQVDVSREAVLSGRAGEPTPRVRAAAERAASLYRLSDGVGRGCVGLAGTAEIEFRRAWLALVLGRPAEAEARLARSVDRGSAPRETRVDLARVRALAGRRDEAIADLRALVAEDPTDVSAHRALADVLEAGNDLAAAASELIIVVNLAPADTASRTHLATLLDQLGRPDEAARYRR